MSGELEAAGALATAGAIGGAIEGREGGAPGEGACLNCGATLEGRFCSNCGQHAQPHRRLTSVLAEFLNGLWHLDTKTWRTLPMVVFRPGTLTRDYVYGKRARYLSPLTMFLFSIFLMFFAFSTIEAPSNFGGGRAAVTAEDLAEARRDLAQARQELQRARASAPAERDIETGVAETAVRISEGEVARLERRLAEQARPAGGAPDVSMSVNGTPVPEGSTWQQELRAAIDRGEVTVNLGHPSLNERALQTLRNPDLALYQIQDAASKFSFLLAPLSLPFIALLFLWKRGVTLYDHMAWALYGLAFAAILFSTVIMLGKLPWTGGAGGLLLMTLPAHMYFHLKGAYALGWFSALWRTVFMLAFAIIVAAIFFSLVVVLGLAG